MPRKKIMERPANDRIENPTSMATLPNSMAKSWVIKRLHIKRNPDKRAIPCKTLLRIPSLNVILVSSHM
jgi:hypothetical protein